MTNSFSNIIDKWMVFVNPHAGTKKGERDWGKIYELLWSSQIKFDFAFTKHKEHAIALTTKYIKKGFRKFIVIGGDGTLNEVINAIFFQKKIPSNDFLIAMIPVGTGNDWCRMFNIPFNYKNAIKVIEKGQTFEQDIGKVSYFQSTKAKRRYFINVAGMGYDAVVAAKTNKDKEKGKGGVLTYLKNLLTSLIFYKHSKIKIEIIDKDDFCECEAFSLSIGICKYNGGGMKQLPNAIPDDGLFDLTLVKKLSKFSVLKEVKNLYDGSFLNHPKVQSFRGKTIKIESTPKINLEADGESLGHSPFQFEIIQKSLRVVVEKPD